MPNSKLEPLELTRRSPNGIEGYLRKRGGRLLRW